MIEVVEAPLSAQNVAWADIFQNVYSQFGEDGVLAEIFRRIGTTNRQCFECGAADGKWFSNSRLLIDQGWTAALIEADERNWPELEKLEQSSGGRVIAVAGRAEAAGENSIDYILSRCGIDERPDLGILDVDGQEYYLWNGMLKFRPRVMVVEYDPAAAIGFVPDLGGCGQAGFAAICSIAVSKGYFNVAVTQTNAIFVHGSEREKFYKSFDERVLPEFARTKSAKELMNEDRRGEIGGSGSIADRRGLHFPPSGIPQASGSPNANGNGNGNGHAIDGLSGGAGAAAPASVNSSPDHRVNEIQKTVTPILAAAAEQEIKICTILSRPRFGLNCFFDCASEGLAPWHIPLSSFYGVFWGQHMQTAMENALEEGVDWMLCLDYDTLFTSRHLQLLIDALGKNPKIDAVAALQVRRGRPLPIAMPAAGTGPLTMTGGPVQVRTAHFGLTLLRVEKLRKLPKPWFWSKPAADGSWGEGRLDDDIYFWANWGDSGNSLFVHTGCRIGHVEEMVAHYDEKGEVRHTYISKWRADHGHQIKSAE